MAETVAAPLGLLAVAKLEICAGFRGDFMGMSWGSHADLVGFNGI